MRVSGEVLRSIALSELAVVEAKRMSRRMRIGWFDWSGGSYDMQRAMARAVRVWFRVQRGVRMSRREAMAF
jgi:hypothetical protein